MTSFFQSFLGCNRSCLGQDHGEVLAEAIWSARRESRQGLIGCVCLGWEAEISEHRLEILAGEASARSLGEGKPAFLPTSFTCALPKIPVITFSSPRPHIACLGFGVCLNGTWSWFEHVEPSSLFSMGTIYRLKTKGNGSRNRKMWAGKDCLLVGP